jgi:hypothetical protein
MGLDMYAYAAVKQGQYREFYEGAEFKDGDFVNAEVSKPRELAYWRKHPSLHGWMRQLWNNRGHDGDFNGDELELFREDLDNLEQDVLDNALPDTQGFFFGNNAADEYRQDDLEFIKNARYELFMGMRVFYNSSW